MCPLAEIALPLAADVVPARLLVARSAAGRKLRCPPCLLRMPWLAPVIEIGAARAIGELNVIHVRSCV